MAQLDPGQMHDYRRSWRVLLSTPRHHLLQHQLSQYQLDCPEIRLVLFIMLNPALFGPPIKLCCYHSARYDINLILEQHLLNSPTTPLTTSAMQVTLTADIIDHYVASLLCCSFRRAAKLSNLSVLGKRLPTRGEDCLQVK